MIARTPLPFAVAAYLDDVVRATMPGGLLASVIVFGSIATGGYAPGISDIDLLIVLADRATAADRLRVRGAVDELERRHGFARKRARPPGALERFAERITATTRSFFVCTRSDLLSGDPARILSIPRFQARFVDRVAIPSMIGSGATFWGEDLLDRVSLPPIRRIDVVKAFWGIFNQVLMAMCAYPFMDAATKYAMDAMKRSVHNCYFCYHLRPAALADQIAFFENGRRPDRTLRRLLALRSNYEPSFGFIVSCLLTVTRLHVRTAAENRFPRDPRQGSARVAMPGTA